MNGLRGIGRKMVFWGAVTLMAWTLYELSIRFEEMMTWLMPVYSLVRDGKITWLDYFQRLNYARLSTHLFLILCFLFACYALLARKGLISGLIAIPIAILLIIFSLGSTPLMSVNLWQKLKLMPLILIALGNVLRLIGMMQKKTVKTRYDGPQTPQKQTYDPFKINRQ